VPRPASRLLRPLLPAIAPHSQRDLDMTANGAARIAQGLRNGPNTTVSPVPHLVSVVDVACAGAGWPWKSRLNVVLEMAGAAFSTPSSSGALARALTSDDGFQRSGHRAKDARLAQGEAVR